MPSVNVSITHLIKRFWRRTLLTWILVVLEGACFVAMPLVIGWAVDGLLEKSMTGLFQLGGLCGALLLIGAGRRFYDTRAYAGIYRTVAGEVVDSEQQNESGISRISARVNLFSEFIEFLENSIPGILHEFINLGGTLIIILFIDVRVFVACLICVGVTMAVYSFSEKRIYQINKGGNDEIEKQVDVLQAGDAPGVHRHFKRLMKWQIRLSDLETINYSLIWIGLASLLLYTIMAVTGSGKASFGQVVSAVMYVFGFIESLLVFPLYYQELIRLQEIASRLGGAMPVEQETSGI